MLLPWRQLVGHATGMGGYDSHVVMAIVANGIVPVTSSLGRC